MTRAIINGTLLILTLNYINAYETELQVPSSRTGKDSAFVSASGISKLGEYLWTLNENDM